LIKLKEEKDENIRKITQLEAEIQELNDKILLDNESFAQLEMKIKIEKENLEKEIELRKNEAEMNDQNTQKLKLEYQVNSLNNSLWY
jgi:TolA-binding protein